MIIVDVRELHSKVPELLGKLHIPYEAKELPVADYLIGEVGVERKTINDFLGSLTSGHLNNQLFELSMNFSLSYLIVEGYVSDALMFRKMKREPVISALVGSSLKRAPEGRCGQVITLQLETPFDTALALKSLHGKVELGEPRLPRFKKVSWDPNEMLEFVVSSIPNIGPKKAKLLLTRFKTIRSLTNATVEGITEIEGFGEKTARGIVETFTRVYEGVGREIQT